MSFLLDYVKNNGLNEKVIFTGYLPKDKMYELLSKASVLVLPSLTRLDSFGIVLLEASSFAIPVIASDIIPGAKELIERSNNGILVPPNDSIKLSEAIQQIADNPRTYGIRGREYVIKHHDWKIVTLAAQQILKESFEDSN